MKKFALLALIVLGTFGLGLAQEEAAAKQLRAIEKKIAKTNTDTEAVRLIQQANITKKAKDNYIKTLPGYGVAATSPDKLKKFRKKAKKEDPKFAKLAKSHNEKQREKREYISTIDPQYKALYDKIKLAQASKKKK